MPFFLTDDFTAELNALARELYRLMGYEGPEGFDYSNSQHPAERMCFVMAERAYDFFRDNGTFDD